MGTQTRNTKKILLISAAVVLFLFLVGIGFFRFLFTSLRWWFALEVIMIAAFLPISRLVPSLPDRGYGLSRFFGLLLITYISWLLASLHIVPYSQSLLIGALLVVGGISAYVLMRNDGIRLDILAFLNKERTYLITGEILFFLAFMLFVNIRSYCPEITFDVGKHAAEKFGNFQVLNSLYRTSYFPPEDAWLAGCPLNYYYFGHLLWASLGKLSSYPSPYAFNLGLSTIFALSFIGGFSLGYNLTRKLAVALFAAFGVAVLGNIQAVLDFLNGLRHGFKLDYIFNAGFLWSASRVIKGTITEFPAFTALLGDLHPHHSGILVILFSLTLCLNLYIRPVPGDMELNHHKWNSRYFSRLLLLILPLGWVIGCSYVISAWDMITVALLFSLTILYATRRVYRHTFWRWVVVGGTAVVIMGILSRLFILPFSRTFINPLPMELQPHILPWKWEIKHFPIAVLQTKNRTHFTDYFVHFGFFLVPIYLWLYLRFKDSFKEKKDLLYLFAGLFPILIIFSLLYFKRMLPGFLLYILITAIILFFREKHGNRQERWVFMILGVATYICLFVEFLFVDDRYHDDLERYNTLFKFYNHVWPMYAVLAGWCWYRLFKIYSSERARRVLTVLLVIILMLSMIYFIGATIERTYRFHKRFTPLNRPERTLNGIAYLGDLKEFKDDYEVIKWARRNIEGRPVVLETFKGPYTSYSRFSTNTGLPTVVGWGHHTAQWNGPKIYTDELGEFKNLGKRERDVRTIYSSRDLETVKPLLEKYNIEYILVGSLERKDYEEEALKKFKALKPVYSSGNTVLYKAP